MVSHTEGREWQSFEGRMRRRRAERMVLRASVAAEVGCIAEGREALAEARDLVPSLPQIAEIERRLEAAEAAAAAATKAGVTWGRAAAFVAAVVALTAFDAGSYRPGPSAQMPVPSRSLLTVASLIKTPAAVAAARAPRTDDDRGFAPAMPAAVTSAPIPRELPVGTSGPARRPVTAALAPIEALPDPPPTLRTDGPDVASPAAAAATAPVAAHRDAPEAAPVAAVSPPPGDETLVRRVLNRYADAYSRLDAGAAQQLWPGLNLGALSRAFEGLASQSISLGDCRINVNGVLARALCSGSATWAPKIGDRAARTERRQWTFELAKTGEDWQIVGARTQNR